MARFDWQPRTRVLFGAGTFAELGAQGRAIGCRHVLLVCDRGIVDCGYAEAARANLAAADIAVSTFHDFAVNPDSAMIEVGRAYAASLGVASPGVTSADVAAIGAAASAGNAAADAAREAAARPGPGIGESGARGGIDGLVALGGGSSLDCAKGINLLLTNGGTIADYRGYGKATRPMLPMIGVPTTAGTGSEAQSYAVIADAATHLKMACGDPKLSFRVAMLDPTLTISQPPGVTVATGFDALSHAVESFVTAKRSPLSDMLAREAWRLIEGHLERVITHPHDEEARAAMLLGAHYAGAAIEQSMLGAAHACANPLTARYDVTHGIAVSLMLPSVVRWNGAVVNGRYHDLLSLSSSATAGALATTTSDADALAARLEQMRDACGFPSSLRAAGVAEADLPAMARDAAGQWTGGFNPRRLDEAGALELYRWAY